MSSPDPSRPGDGASRRFHTLTEVAELLATSQAQVYALVRNGELPAIKIGGRGQWRIEATVLEDWIAHRYQQTKQFVAANPL
jgi:excisionase family DNA binding protein